MRNNPLASTSASTPSAEKVQPAANDPPETSAASQATPPDEKWLLEIGWLVCDNLDAVDKQAITAARDQVREFLAQSFPEFDWRMPIETREQPSGDAQREAVEYLQWETAQRDLRGWDFVFAFVKPDLIARQRSHAWVCVSRSLDSAVISTARIDPRADDPDSEGQHRTEALASRLRSLTLRSLGHLCGLATVDDSHNAMGMLHDVTDLDASRPFHQQQLEQMAANLRRVADLRLEEEQSIQKARWWSFYPRAVWRNRLEIIDGLRKARPWQMPIRLARLTIAAISTMVVLVMTEEAWTLASRQSAPTVVVLSLIAVVATIVYVLERQGLLIRNRPKGLTEQVVTTNFTTTAIITVGIATTYVCLFLLTVLLGATLFDFELVANWTGNTEKAIGARHYLIFAGFVSAVGIVIGALGASFEGHHYFRHITFVDEEI